MPSRSSTQRSPSKRIRFTSDRGAQHSLTQTSTGLSSDAKCDPWAAMRGVHLLPAAPGTPTWESLPEPGALHGPHNTEYEMMEASIDTPPKRQSNTIAPSVRMTQFMDEWAPLAFCELLAVEAPPPDMRCSRCPQGSGHARSPLVVYRCVECLRTHQYCQSCMISTHESMPFHRIEQWTDEKGFWEKKCLADLGLRLHLGHDSQKCPIAINGPREMTIVHEHGISIILIHFCECLHHHTSLATPDSLQLLRCGLFPGSWEKPRTAFTVQVLKSFHLLALQSQITAHDFMRYLRRKTDNVFPDSTPDRYRELLITMREWTYLVAVKRAGQAPARNMTIGSLAVLCPACPQPDINMAPNWRERPHSQSFLDALFHTIDGNFHQNQKIKPLDPNDFPLTLGAGYFAHEGDFEAYQKLLGPMEREPSTCHQFGAMGYGGYWGKVSGTVGLSCARHMFVLPGGGVDLQKGERFANVDFAMASGLKRWMELRLHVSGYDINCQYRIHFDKRMAWMGDNTGHLPAVSGARFPTTVAAVGKFHLPAHKASCRYKFSYHWLPGVGMTDGEAPERIWAILNDIGGSTREMTSGHRHDVINDHHSDMNVRRTHSIVKATSKKYDQARTEYVRAKDALQRLETQIEPGTLAQWKVEEQNWLEKVVDMKQHDTLHNPYEPRNDKGLTQRQALNLLQRRGDGVDAMGAGMVGAVVTTARR
ncbi:hypothetical protein HETIRDRAFT_322626 [Heterobasidion irregulare TC 32-1]|uniref:CxC2-like cysteine cluster KDZ transposase-associated domain-containing protein n=1 Tax=Heterobasidion irregulare (strain TC 32-1) TaxID=747525 RepID=W4K117_HETIT|nr:uncharacterized protein HETIRDRAFT_322626 [Heterobasidion irregulare TC 32-1]ETW79409.1 hypothetical protein HETIRDRAFT_322626 [Heterobasidion irregulare TC 32-1]